MAAKLVFILTFLMTSLCFASDTHEAIIKYLASDKLEGRKPGQTGNELAQKYLETKFQSYGLEVLDKSYFQEFTIFTEMKKKGENSLTSNGNKISFEPIAYSLSGESLNTKAVFAGYGISIPGNDPKLKYDDYNGIDVTDKVVIVMTGDPGIGNPKSKFRDPDYQNYSSLFYKLKNAITKGAKGIILINDPLTLEITNTSDRVTFNGSEGGGSRFSIISGKASVKEIDNLFKSKDLLEIQKTISKTQKPASFESQITMDLKVSLKKETGRISNIVALKHGKNKEVIVIGAHMDHLGFGGESSMDQTRLGEIHNGADDNASGTAAVLKIAEHFSKIETNKTLAFVLFNAEEMGLLGSSHFVEMWNGRYKNTYGEMKAMLNLDMVGRYNKEVSVMGTDSFKNTSILASPNNRAFNYTLKKEAVGSSDHAVFMNAKVPSLFITTGAHDDYHRPSDTEEKIHYPALKDITNYSISLVQSLNSSNQIAWNENYSSGNQGGRNRGYGASLGCVPEFGQSDDIIGVVCVKASPGSPAELAGIKPQDILVQIGDIDVKSIYDLAFALKYYRAGDTVEIAWKRNQTLMKQTIVLAKSSRH